MPMRMQVIYSECVFCNLSRFIKPVPLIVDVSLQLFIVFVFVAVVLNRDDYAYI